MTLVEITYELQSPLTEEQLRHLGQFANTYGLRSFRVDESKNQLSFEYDASRLRETQVAHVLGQANRHRGEGRPSSPATPPYMRVRIRRFGGLS